jgi:hypothetical protein
MPAASAGRARKTAQTNTSPCVVVTAKPTGTLARRPLLASASLPKVSAGEHGARRPSVLQRSSVRGSTWRGDD